MGLASRPAARLAPAVTPQRPRKTLHPKPKPQKVRLRVTPKLTEQEVKRLRDNASADLRSVGAYVAGLVERDLRKRAGGKGRPVRGARAGDRRAVYDVAVPLTVAQRTRLEERAAEQDRSLSSYVARVIVEALARR